MILTMKTGYNENFILQSVESDKEMLEEEWKSINWHSIEHSIFKIQKRISEAEKEKDFYTYMVDNFVYYSVLIFIFSYKICLSRVVMKVTRSVLRRERGSNPSDLSDIF